jgi:hypothetical protein
LQAHGVERGTPIGGWQLEKIEKAGIENRGSG